MLGHHRDDILETFFMNLFHGGRLATMPPKLVNEEGDLFLYRPLAHVAEADCERFAAAMNYPIIPCDLCGSQDGLQRQQVKQILDGWERNSPGRRQVMFRALMNARPSHLLDPALFDFAALALDPKPQRRVRGIDAAPALPRSRRFGLCGRETGRKRLTFALPSLLNPSLTYKGQVQSLMDDQNKNLILATALSLVVILVWFFLFPPPEAGDRGARAGRGDRDADRQPRACDRTRRGPRHRHGHRNGCGRGRRNAPMRWKRRGTAPADPDRPPARLDPAAVGGSTT